MADSLSQVRRRNVTTPQDEQADERQVKNNAGGFAFEVSDEDRIMRFLVLGTDGGTYYQKEREYTAENAAVVIDFAKNHGVKLVDLVHEISTAGRALRQNPAIFALAAVFAFGDTSAKQDAQNVFNSVVRTGTHLFLFVKYTEQLRGWGRGVKRAVASWYTAKNVNDLSYQMVKYRQREGWTHRDVLRSVHPEPVDAEQNALFAWACGKNNVFRGDGHAIRPGWVLPYQAVTELGKIPGRHSVFADVIREHPGLPWEALPDIALTYPETWEALLANGMPLGALLRNLSKMTAHGVLTGDRLDKVTSALTSTDHLKAARIHPVKILYALKTYASGRNAGRGSSTWTPVREVTDALDAAFYASFGTVEPAGKRTLVALDVSGSMTWDSSRCGILTAREGSAAMAMVTLASEPHSEVVAFASGANRNYGQFSSGIMPVDLTPRRRLDDNLRTIETLWAGGTDCSLPMIWAEQQRKAFDTFVVYTDNETWAGRIHPHEALRLYRQKTGINARLIVAGMSSTGFTIADPSDPLMLDVAGFDASTPQVISGFSRGDF